MKKKSGPEGTEKIPGLSLAQFVSGRREKLGFSQSGLAMRCSLELCDIENIEAGIELFLASTVRQKLAKGLKLNPAEIKPYEHDIKLEQEHGFFTQNRIEEIKDEILQGQKVIQCPICAEILVVRVAKMYDLEDNLMLHPKARCVKCPFQIK